MDAATELLVAMTFANLHTGLGIVQQSGLNLTNQQLDRASRELQHARSYGRAWHLNDATAALNRAYAALGSVNPMADEIDAWHSGRHPIQELLAERMAG